MAPSNWTEAELLRLIADGIPEGTDLEYKSLEALQYNSDPERKKHVIFEISKDVSSMANAAGGHIIYGIREEEHLPCQLQQCFALSEGKHEWLENIIGSSIKPRITDLRILRVPLSTSSPGNEALVVYVPRSLSGHQANDGRYYQRQNFSIIRLEDYQIRDLMNRPKHAVVDFTIEHTLLDTGHGREHTYALLAALANTGPIRIRDLRVEILVPARMFGLEGQIASNPRVYNITSFDDEVERLSGLSYDVKRIVYETTDKPIFPTQRVTILGYLSTEIMRPPRGYKTFSSI